MGDHLGLESFSQPKMVDLQRSVGNSFFDFAMKTLLKISERIPPQKRLNMSLIATLQTNHPGTTESFNQENWLRFVCFLSSKWEDFTFLKLFSLLSQNPYINCTILKFFMITTLQHIYFSQIMIYELLVL